MRKKAPRQFKVVIEIDEDGFFVASVPALPGCHTQARNPKELKENLKDAITLCLEEAAEDPGYRKQIELLGYEPSFVGVESITI